MRGGRRRRAGEGEKDREQGGRRSVKKLDKMGSMGRHIKGGWKEVERREKEGWKERDRRNEGW